MGSRKTLLSLSIKRVATLASVLGAVGGFAVATASAQTARFEPLNQNSARILSSQPAFLPSARQQATVNRRALVRRGRMVSAGFRQEPGVLGTVPPQPTRPGLQQQDKRQGFFGEDQPVPTIPRNAPPAPNRSQPRQQQGRSVLQEGELPEDIFRNPFDKERQPAPGKKSVEIPGELLTEPQETVPRQRERQDDTLERPNQQRPANPFLPGKKENSDDQIDYQPGRGLDTTRSRSNVYQPPSADRHTQPDNGVYFVPAYDPIPGTQHSTLAPPTTITPTPPAWQQQPAWGHQHVPQQPQYQQPQYRLAPVPHAPHLQFAPVPAGHNPPQQVYTPVVEPPANPTWGSKGPMTHVRRGLFGKIQQDLKRDWGFGDYQSCMDAGSCSGCDSGCGSSVGTTCPVFYVGFQGAWNDAFDVANSQGSELELDDGSAFFFSLGRMNGRNLRTEIELSFRNNDISSLLTSDAELPATGELQTFSGMANLYWEFVNFPTGRLKPYIGGGVGFTSVSSDFRLASDPSSQDDSTESNSSFAYQWMAGVNFKVSNHLDLYGEYRFLDVESFGISSDRDELSGDFGYSANSIGGGLRWKF